MGRYSEQKSYNHRIDYVGWLTWRMYWTVDRYYSGSRLRYPTQFSRDTDEEGARRFCKRHELDFPRSEK